MPYLPGHEAAPHLLTLSSKCHSSCSEAAWAAGLPSPACPCPSYTCLAETHPEGVREVVQGALIGEPGAKPSASLSLSFSPGVTTPDPQSGPETAEVRQEAQLRELLQSLCKCELLLLLCKACFPVARILWTIWPEGEDYQAEF